MLKRIKAKQIKELIIEIWSSKYVVKQLVSLK